MRHNCNKKQMQSMTHKKVIEKELDGFGIRLNQKPPDIVFRKKDKGGLNYQEIVPQVKCEGKQNIMSTPSGGGVV